MLDQSPPPPDSEPTPDLAEHTLRMVKAPVRLDYAKMVIDYVDVVPKPVEIRLPFVEYFERIKRHKADSWQIDFCNRLEEAFANRHVDTTMATVHAEAQLGKPLSVETLVLMADGSYKRLGDVEVGDVVITHLGRPRKVLQVFEQGELDCLDIRTNCGRSVTTALDHPFLTPEGWTEAKDLVVDQALGCVPESQISATRDRTNDDFELLGYYLGDGCVTAQGGTFQSSITSGDPEQTARIIEIATRMGFGYRIHQKAKTKAVTIALKGGVRDWIRSSGIAGSNSWTKRVPAWAFCGSQEQIGYFLGAYFSCDGTFGRQRNTVIDFGSVSIGLLQDIQKLLLRVGIQSRLAIKNGVYQGARHQSHRLYFCSQDFVAQFIEKVPIAGRKGVELKAMLKIRKTFQPSILTDNIVSIEPAGKHQCRCIEVEEDHTFTANDLIVHNSTILAQCYPAYILGHDPMHRVALATYNVSRSQTHSRSVIQIMNLPVHKAIFPEPAGFVNPNASKEKWSTETRRKGTDAQDSFNPVGLQSGLTGSGFDCFPAETLVNTEAGRIAIGDLFVLKYIPKVYAFNHLTNQVELRKVEALREMPADELIEIRTSQGRVFRCTPNHRIYVNGRGYITADKITEGDTLQSLPDLQRLQTSRKQALPGVQFRGETSHDRQNMRLVLNGLSNPSLSGNQKTEKRPYQSILFPSVLQRMECDSREATEQILLNVQGADSKRGNKSKVLFKRVLAETVNDVFGAKNLPEMPWVIRSQKQPDSLLLSSLCEHGPLITNDRERELSVQEWEQLCEVVQRNAANRYGKGWPQVRSVSTEAQADNCGTSRDSQRAEQARYSPHQSSAGEQQGNKSRYPMLPMSQIAPQLGTDTVTMARQIRGISVNVYDLQVEGCGNFFAEQILVHNSLIIDDPYADQKEAFSETVRKNLQEFWDYTVMSRIGSHANVFGMFHRYHVEDLAGYLLTQKTFDYWRYATIADGPYIHDETGQRFDDPLGRKEGEYISPDRRPPSYYVGNQKNKRVWNSMFQGRPSSEEGEFFNIGKFNELNAAETKQFIAECTLFIRAWDNAATEEGGDWSVGFLIGMKADGSCIIIDIVRKQVDTAGRLALQKRTAEKDGPDVLICVPEDPGSGGKDAVEYVKEKLKGFTVIARKPTGSKEDRARPMSDTVNSGMMSIGSEAHLDDDDKWHKQLKTEFRNFPLSEHDDIVDSGSDAYNEAFSRISKGRVIKNYTAQSNLVLWDQFAARYRLNGKPLDKVPANWTIYAGIKVTPEANTANSAVIVARAALNTGLDETLFVLAEYKEFTDDVEAAFEWLDVALEAYCSNSENATVWLHPDSASYRQTIIQKLNRQVAMFTGEKTSGISELDWYLSERETASPFNSEIKATGLYGMIVDPYQYAVAVDEFGLRSMRQEFATWNYTDKGEPSAVGAVLECLRMICFCFRTVPAELSRVEKIEAALGESIRTEAIKAETNPAIVDQLLTRRMIELQSVEQEIDRPVRNRASRFGRR